MLVFNIVSTLSIDKNENGERKVRKNMYIDNKYCAIAGDTALRRNGGSTSKYSSL